MGSESANAVDRSDRYRSLLDRGFSEEEKKALLGRYVPHELGEAELQWFCTVCLESRLNPFLEEIAADWDFDERRPEKRKLVAITKISGYRAIADRTGLYQGQTTPLYCGSDGVWKEVWLEEEAPKACKIGIYRANFSEPLYAVVLFKEHVRRARSSPYWLESPVNQLGIRAEAAALRKAFPQLSALAVKEEVNCGRFVEGVKEGAGVGHAQKPLVILKTARVEGLAGEETNTGCGKDKTVDGSDGDRDGGRLQKIDGPLTEWVTPYDYVVSLSGGGSVSLGEISSDLFQGLCRKHLLKSSDLTAKGSPKEYLAKVFLDLVEASEALKETMLVGTGVKIAGRTVRLTLNAWRGMRLGRIELDSKAREKVDPIIKRYPLGGSEKFLAESVSPERRHRSGRSTRGV